jgi:hypothetical protein
MRPMVRPPEPNSRLIVMIFFSMEIPPFSYIIVKVLFNVNKEDTSFGRNAEKTPETTILPPRGSLN